MLDWLRQFDPQAAQEELRGLLGQMLFSGEDALKPTDALSGGESARLIFCRLMLQKPNFLVLDEPTNHLDLESINALNIALQKYQGTVLLVTHDHDVIDEVATRIWHFEGGHDRGLQGAVRGFSGLCEGAGFVGCSRNQLNFHIGPVAERCEFITSRNLMHNISHGLCAVHGLHSC